ncbi:MAG: rane-bound hydrogenase subunit alpha [bacterium]|nr:rane-bound hydrogenase subunit alpha [bacterium]
MGTVSYGYNVPIGPIHPALKEPIEFHFEIEGEKVKKVEIHAGHAHRGIEWIGTRRNPIQCLYIAERICGICSVTHALALALAVERALNIEVPPRAQYIRLIIAELERIHSHILWAGVAAHEVGFDSAFMLLWKLRENVMDLLEKLTGNRVNYGIMQIGGVRRDITDELRREIWKSLDYYRTLSERIKVLLLEDPTFVMRTRNVGILTKEDALSLCAVGPTLRASGIPKDIRQDQPYIAYADVGVKAITPDLYTGEVVGDVYDKTVVRLLEIDQSIELIDKALTMMPEGEILYEKNLVKLLNLIKKGEGEGVGRHEAPRGEDVHYVKLVEGSENLAAWKIRAPTYNNLLPWVPMFKDAEVADIPIIVASTDPCMSCLNRVTVVHPSGRKEILTHEELHRLSVEKTRRMRRR